MNFYKYSKISQLSIYVYAEPHLSGGNYPEAANIVFKVTFLRAAKYGVK